MATRPTGKKPPAAEVASRAPAKSASKTRPTSKVSAGKAKLAATKSSRRSGASRLMDAQVALTPGAPPTLDQLAKLFDSFALSVAEYARDHVNDLSDQDYEKYFEYHDRLAAYAGNLNNAAAIAHLSNLPVDVISTATDAMNAAVANLKKAANVIDMVATAVSLGLALTSSDLGQIIASVSVAKHLLDDAGVTKSAGAGS